MTASARCLAAGCGWTAAGTQDGTDRAAEKHTKTTRHPTITLAAPAAATERTRP